MKRNILVLICALSALLLPGVAPGKRPPVFADAVFNAAAARGGA